MAKKNVQQQDDPETQRRAAQAVKVATDLIDNWEEATRTRFNTVREYEENYLGKVRPRTSGRSNFPVPVLSRYVDEIHSRLDETPNIIVDSDVSMARKLVARKASALIKDLKKPSKGNWNRYDRLSKRHAEFAGYNAVDFYSETVNGKFKLCFLPIHHTEFVFEVGGGTDLENHMGVGKFPIWRNEGELKSRAAAGTYSKSQVEKLASRYNASDFKKHMTFFLTRSAHLKSLGIDVENHSFAGSPIYPLAQMQLTLDFGDGSERYLLTFDYWSGVWVRFQKLEDVFPSGMYSIDYWQTSEEDEVTCKGPCDDIFPFAEGIRVKVNQLFDNHTRRIYAQRGYDPNFVPDPSQLVWKTADQLTKMKSYGGKPISSGFVEFKTEDMTASTLEFVKWMDDFLVSVVGINPNDVSEETKKVGIMFGQLQKTAARLGSKNKSYNEMWQRLGTRALHEMKAFLKDPQSIQLIGTKGVEWTEFSGSELDDPNSFNIITEGSNIELEMSEARKKRQQEALSIILKDPDLKQENNPRALTEAVWKSGDYAPEEIARFMDKATYGNEEVIARADMSCEEILKGKKPQIYQGADDAFMQFIMEFAQKLEGDDNRQVRIDLMTYGRAHKSIAVRNMANKGVSELAKKGIQPNQVNVPMLNRPPAPQNQPAPGPRAPSPAVHAKVKGRGVRPIGHMPVPKVGSGRMPMPSRNVHARVTSRGARSPVPTR